MHFTSFSFLVLFPLIVLLYNLIPQRGKVWFLLVVSYLFYITLQPVFTLLLVMVTLCTYLFTRSISQTKSEKKKHRLLVWGIIITILPLFFFKYFRFINESIFSIFNNLGLNLSSPEISFVLPIGISFYTFMAIGYIVDVYYEEVGFENNIASIGLFLSFFPIILSGPIERAGNMLPQFKKLQNTTYEHLVAGSKMMLWGYFMKLCVADRIGMYVDAVFNHITQHNGTSLAFASILYPLQVYADFGGYSLIAIGIARCLGIKVILNFNRPFFSTSMSEFWHRWHISLIQWLTDYIYTPLSFSLRSWKMWGLVTALMLTFLISGIWHGASLTFIVWGLIQGLYLTFEAISQKKRTTFRKKYHLNLKWWYTSLSWIIVFVLFAFSQIFARCNNVNDALIVIRKIFFERGDLFIGDDISVSLGFVSLLILVLKDYKDEFNISLNFMSSKYLVMRYVSAILLIVYILLFGVLKGGNFIYFQF